MQGSFKGRFLFSGYELHIRKSSSSEKDIEGLKRRERFDVENFATQYYMCLAYK